MKINVVKKQTVEEYAKLSNAQRSFEDWLTKIKFADWNTSKNILSTFNSADLLGAGSSRVVFNIGGNRYRMICKYNFWKSTTCKLRVHLFVCWIGTHAAYSELCRDNKQYSIKF